MLATPARSVFHIIADGLRAYQRDAMTATFDALLRDQHPVIAHPTGSGKSLLVGALGLLLPGRVLIISHRKELLVQDSEKLLTFAQTSLGLYSAGLKRRETDDRVIIGGVQSIYRRMDELQATGAFAYLIIDECHVCPPRSQPTTMYAQILQACPDAQRIGLSATPYRLDGGLVYEGPDCWFDTLAHEVGIRALTPHYLAPLAGLLSAHEVDVSNVRTKQGEYVLSDLSQAASEESVVEGALDDILAYGAKRDHWIIFCVDVAHAHLVTAQLRARGIPTGMVVGTTPQDERDATFEDFRTGRILALTNVMVASVGFDFPGIDLIALLRPTQSRALAIQMIGRGSRQSPGKVDALLLDFAGILEKHAPLDGVFTLAKTPARQKADDAREERERQERERKARHAAQASTLDPMATTPDTTAKRYRVERITYAVKESKRFPGKHMLIATYLCPERIGRASVTAFICIEYEGWARQIAEAWFARRHRIAPETARDALHIAWGLPIPTHIVIQKQGRFDRILMEHFTDDE